MKDFVRLLLRPTVKPVFWFSRWFRHNIFLRNMNSLRLPTPAFLSQPFLFFEYYVTRIYKLWRSEFIDYGLKQYSKFIPRHYAKGGWGYLDVEMLTDEECARRYDALNGRIRYYIESYARLLGYSNGDTFLDVGCGLGQNIKVLTQHFPDSVLKGFDVNEATLRVIRVGTKANLKVQLEVGSATDQAYLAKIPGASVDHVIISHVLPHLLAQDVSSTQALRQGLIDHLVRIAKKSVLVIDCIRHEQEDEPQFVLEQNNRCALNESPARYFVKYRNAGEVCLLFGPGNEALLFKKL